MNRYVWIFLILGLIASCTEIDEVAQEKTLTSIYVSRPVQIDGKLQEWPAQLDTIYLTDRENLSDNVMIVKSVWSLANLYLAFQVSDFDLRAYQTELDHKKLFLDDMVEFLLDTQMDRSEKWLGDDIIYHLNLQGQKKDDRGTASGESDASWHGDAVYGVSLQGTLNDTTDSDQGYVVEVAVPWTEIGRNPESGLEMGLNVACGDNDGKGRMLFDWVDAWPTRSPDVFGTLVLKKE
jgi:hexosaminidase